MSAHYFGECFYTFVAWKFQKFYSFGCWVFFEYSVKFEIPDYKKTWWKNLSHAQIGVNLKSFRPLKFIKKLSFSNVFKLVFYLVRVIQSSEHFHFPCLYVIGLMKRLYFCSPLKMGMPSSKILKVNYGGLFSYMCQKS